MILAEKKKWVIRTFSQDMNRPYVLMLQDKLLS